MVDRNIIFVLAECVTGMNRYTCHSAFPSSTDPESMEGLDRTIENFQITSKSVLNQIKSELKVINSATYNVAVKQPEINLSFLSHNMEQYQIKGVSATESEDALNDLWSKISASMQKCSANNGECNMQHTPNIVSDGLHKIADTLLPTGFQQCDIICIVDGASLNFDRHCLLYGALCRLVRWHSGQVTLLRWREWDADPGAPFLTRDGTDSATVGDKCDGCDVVQPCDGCGMMNSLNAVRRNSRGGMIIPECSAFWRGCCVLTDAEGSQVTIPGMCLHLTKNRGPVTSCTNPRAKQRILIPRMMQVMGEVDAGSVPWTVIQNANQFRLTCPSCPSHVDALLPHVGAGLILRLAYCTATVGRIRKNPLTTELWHEMMRSGDDIRMALNQESRIYNVSGPVQYFTFVVVRDADLSHTVADAFLLKDISLLEQAPLTSHLLHGLPERDDYNCLDTEDESSLLSTRYTVNYSSDLNKNNEDASDHKRLGFASSAEQRNEETRKLTNLTDFISFLEDGLAKKTEEYKHAIRQNSREAATNVWCPRAEHLQKALKGWDEARKSEYFNVYYSHRFETDHREYEMAQLTGQWKGERLSVARHINKHPIMARRSHSSRPKLPYRRTESSEGSGSAPRTEGSGSAPMTECFGSDPRTEGSGSAPMTECFRSDPRTEGSGSARITEGSGSARRTEGSGSASMTQCFGSARRTEGSGSAPLTECFGSARRTEGSGSAPMTESFGSARRTEGSGCDQRPEGHGSARPKCQDDVPSSVSNTATRTSVSSLDESMKPGLPDQTDDLSQCGSLVADTSQVSTASRSRAERHKKQLMDIVVIVLKKEGITKQHKLFAPSANRLYKIVKSFLSDLPTSRGLAQKMKTYAEQNVKQTIAHFKAIQSE